MSQINKSLPPFLRKLLAGAPYVKKEAAFWLSRHTSFFVARPRIIHLWRHASCNGQCVMCNWALAPISEKKQCLDTAMPDQEVTRLLQEAHDLGGRGTIISYMGGEPLLCKSLIPWLRLSRDAGLDFRFTTNGYLLDRDAARSIVECDPFNIGISLESLDPHVNETLRPVSNGTEKTLNGIELILAERERLKSRVSVNVKCTLTQINFPHVLDIARKFGKREGVMITPQPFEIVANMPPDIRAKLWISDTEGLRRVLENLVALKREGYHVNVPRAFIEDFVRRYTADPTQSSSMNANPVTRAETQPCYIGYHSLFVENDGSVKLCPRFPAIGNSLARQQTLSDMWYSRKASDMRSDMTACMILCTMSCLRETSLWHKIRLFLQA